MRLAVKSMHKELQLFLLLLNISFGLFFLFYTNNGHAKVYEQFYEKHAEGWHWYNAEELKEQEKTEKKKAAINSQDSTKKMDALRSTVKRALHKAILNPTESNIKNYIFLQNKISNQATLFANVWQKILLENPSLNYSLVHPTNSLAKPLSSLYGLSV